MPSWKKLIVSGSDASLSSLTATSYGGNISGSLTSTGSFGSVMQNGKHFPQTNAPGENIAFGTDAGSAFVGGNVNKINIAIGLSAGKAMADYGGNVFIGKNAAKLRTRGDSNVAIGDGAGGTDGDDFGDKNVFIGLNTGTAINSTNSDGNVFIGSLAGTAGQQSIANVIIGSDAGKTLTDSSRNVAIGVFAGTGFGVTNTTTENSIYIGQYARTSVTNANNEIVIGSEAVGHGTDTITFGDNQITDVHFASGSSTGATFHGVKDFSGNISGSATSTGSFGTLQVGGQHIFGDADGIGIGKANPTALLHLAKNDADVAIILEEINNRSWHMAIDQSNSDRLTFGYSATIGNNNVLTLTENDEAIFSGNVSGSATSTGSFGRLNILNEFHTEPGGYLYGDSGNPNLRLSNSSGVKLAYAGVYFQALAASINIVATSEPITIKNDDTSLILTNDNQISGSATSTGSFGHLLVGGSELTSSPDATDGSQSTISGSATSTGSFGILELDKYNGGIGHNNNVNFGVGAGTTGAGDANLAIGYNAGSFSNAGSSLNIAIGWDAQGHWSDADGDRNIAIGYQAQYDHNGGDDNIAIGYQAMKNGEGSHNDNIAIGTDAMQAIGAGASRNIGMGDRVMHGLVGGTDNIGIGKDVLFSNQAGDYNVALGTEALYGINAESADKNVAIGYRAGIFITNGSTEFSDGDSNVFIGSETKPAADDESNQIIIGANAIGKGSNTALIGDDNITDIYMSEDVGATLHTGQIIASGSANATDTIKIYGNAAGNVGNAGITFDLDNSTNDAEAYLRLDRTSGTAYLGLTMQSDGRDGMRFMTGTTEHLRIDGNDISGSGASVFSVGSLETAGNITPKVDDSVDLGAADKRFKNIFTTDLQLSNEGKEKGNEVDGTTGSWTIQEGEEELYLLNRKNGKKYKFMLQEIK